MKPVLSLKLFSFFALMILLFSLLSPTAVLADEGTPPESTPEAVETETPEALPTEAPASQPELPVILELLPAETGLVALDETGQALPLASVAAAEILETGDPIWCPAGQDPATDMNDGEQDCTDYFKRFTGENGLIEALEYDASRPDYDSSSRYVGPGTIYVQSGEIANKDQHKSIKLNGSRLENISGYDLTIQGGWNINQENLSLSYFVGDQSVFADSRFLITQWNGAVTINNLDLLMSVETKEKGSALVVETTGAITLNQVNVENAWRGHGAELTSYFESVEVNQSSFTNNQEAGLYVEASQITLNNVTATENGAQGADLQQLRKFGFNRESEPESPEVVINGGLFSGNQKQGLRVQFEGGSVTVDGAQVDHNGSVEADRSGIRIEAETISLKNVTSSQNGKHGANLWAWGEVQVLNSTFSDNQERGLLVHDYASVEGPNFMGDGEFEFFEPFFETEAPYDPYALLVEVSCSQFTGNGDGGLEVRNWYGLTNLQSNVFSNNTNYDQQIEGYVLTSTGLCGVSGGEERPKTEPKYDDYLDSVGRGPIPGCQRAGGRILYTSKGDQVLVPCGPGGEAFASNAAFQKLPGGIYQPGFVDSINFTVIGDNGKKRAVLPVSVVISFDLPYGEAGNYAIMFWNGDEWIDLAEAGGGNRIVTSAGSVVGNRFEAIVNFTGLFALVRK